MIDIIPYYYQMKLSPSSLILGAFDAIHNGHLQLIKQAKLLNLPITITLFDNISQIPSKQVKWSYSSLDIKLKQLAKLGVSRVIIVDFMNIRNLSGAEFIDHITRLTNAKQIVVGYNFGYGKNRINNQDDLIKQFSQTIVVPPFMFKGRIVSTSLLKQLITLGEVDAINDLAPFPYTITGSISAQGVVELDDKSGLHSGVYGVFVEIDHIRYYGVYAHGLNKYTIMIPDLTFKQAKYKAQIIIITHIRHIINKRDDRINNDDLLLSKNKLTTYVKNRI